MQMSFAEAGSSLPAWAQRANEPLVPSLDLAAVKKSVNADLKEVRRATEALTKLAAAARKGVAPGGKGFGAQVLEVRSAAMDRARTTGRTLREAQALAEDGSPEQRALTALREEYNATLGRFRQQVEATSHLVESVRPSQPDLESGGGGGARNACCGGGTAPASVPAAEADDAAHEQQQLQQQQMQMVETNEAVIADREQGINHLNRSVQEVAEIFQDLALLVNEQGAQIDNIQTNIESAATSTEKGVRELARASRHQRRTRSRMCIIFACVLVVIILLVVVLKFGLHKLNR